MSAQDHWERQRREIDSYNLFYSSFPGLDNEQSLKNIGFKSPSRFPKIPIRDRTRDAKPDFISFNGSTLLLAEIKSGSNLPNSYIRQIERVDSVTIEDGEDFLVDSDYLDNQEFSRGDISSVEPCIIFNKNRFDDRISPHNDDELNELESYCGVLSQSRGGSLQIERGGFTDSDLDSLLTAGISLPQVPSTTVFLSEQVEKESLAVSICYDHVIPDLKHGPQQLSIADIRHLYPERAFDIEKVEDVMKFLHHIGVCSKISNREYEFDDNLLDEAFRVTSIVSEQQVDEYLSASQDDDDQSEIGDF